MTVAEIDEYFLDDAKIALVAYGSESRPAREAVTIARKEGIKAGLLKLNTIWPVPEKQLRAVARQVARVLAVEMNIGKYSGEIERVCCGCCSVSRITKNSGQIHTSSEIYQAIRESLN